MSPIELPTYEEVMNQAMIDDMVELEPHPQFEKLATIKRPDVSVLIPAYNCRHTLRRAVMSAVNQESVSVQVVIAEDASTDDTLAVAVKLASVDNPNVWLYRRETNGRIAATLNDAGAQATGRYIIRCDSDDWLGENCLAPFVAALDTHPEIGFVYGARQYYGRRSDVYRPQPFSRAAFDLHNAAGYCYMFRRKIWDDGLRWRALGTFGGAVIDLEDWQHLQAMLAQGIVGMALPEVLALHYLLRWDGTWGELQSNQAEALAEFKRLWPNVKAESL